MSPFAVEIEVRERANIYISVWCNTTLELKKFAPVKKRLLSELKSRCYQIGIPAEQEPKITWTKTQFTWYTGDMRRHRNILGRADWKNNVINIDLYNHKMYKHGIKEIRHTLIHELVHMRFQYQKHGKTFEKLIERILAGEVFPIRTQADMRPGSMFGPPKSVVYTLPNGLKVTMTDLKMEDVRPTSFDDIDPIDIDSSPTISFPPFVSTTDMFGSMHLATSSNRY